MKYQYLNLSPFFKLFLREVQELLGPQEKQALLGHKDLLESQEQRV